MNGDRLTEQIEWLTLKRIRTLGNVKQRLWTPLTTHWYSLPSLILIFWSLSESYLLGSERSSEIFLPSGRSADTSSSAIKVIYASSQKIPTSSPVALALGPEVSGPAVPGTMPREAFQRLRASSSASSFAYSSVDLSSPGTYPVGNDELPLLHESGDNDAHLEWWRVRGRRRLRV